MARYKTFQINRGQNSVNTFIPNPSNFVIALALDGLGETTYTLEPDDAGYFPQFVIYSFTADTFMQFNDPAVVPTVDITDGTAPVLNPSHRSINKSIESLSFISETPSIVTLEFYV